MVEENTVVEREIIQLEDEINTKKKKDPKRGIIYLSTIPPYMNVTKIRETFSQFGKIGRVFLQLGDKDRPLDKNSERKLKKRKVAKKFSEGWVEFERKSVAKRVATMLNNTQISTRKKSKHYDCIWNLKYLSNFKWTHLHERLAYERAARNKKLKAEIQLAKKKTNVFTSNLDKKRKNNTTGNKEYEDFNKISEVPDTDSNKADSNNRNKFLQSLFS